MGTSLQFIKPNFFEIFHENTKEARIAFFSDKLVQFLWTKFKNERKQEIKDHIEQLYEQEHGQLKVWRLM